nr:MAG TPA: hypothetical protein [Crassvirales sp.]
MYAPFLNRSGVSCELFWLFKPCKYVQILVTVH